MAPFAKRSLVHLRKNASNRDFDEKLDVAIRRSENATGSQEDETASALTEQ